MEGRREKQEEGERRWREEVEGGGGGRRWREAARDGFTVRRDKCQRWGVEGRGGGGGLRVEGEG